MSIREDKIRRYTIILLFFKLDKMESKENAYRCIKTLMDRHDVLRTSFYFDGKSVCQRVEDHVEPDISYYYQDNIEDIDYHDLITPFDLSKAPLFKVSIIELKKWWVCPVF